MGIISSAAFSKAVYPRPFTGWLGLGYEMYPDLVPECFTVKSSDQSIEEDTILSGLSTMQRVSEGGSNPYDDMGQQRTQQYIPADYRLGFIVTKNLIRDGKGLKVVEEGSKQLGVAYNETRNITAYSLMNNAFNGTIVSADNSTLITSTHASTSGNYSNILSTNASLSEASIEQMRIDLKAIKNDRGIRMQVRPMKLVVPANLEFEATRYLESEYRPSSSDNDINVINKVGLFKDGKVVIDYLTDSNAWFVLTNVSEHGLTFWQRQDLELSNDTFFDNDNARFKGHARWMVGCSEWRHIFGSQGL